MPEPAKYEQAVTSSGKKTWRLTAEWKEWDRERKLLAKNRSKPKPKTVRRVVTAENHEFRWKEVASFSDSQRKIYFCCCMSEQGSPYRGCGAVGVQNSRTSDMQIMREPRFEEYMD